jgi:flagellar biosynthesis/type III secretory pathway protein FliH
MLLVGEQLKVAPARVDLVNTHFEEDLKMGILEAIEIAEKQGIEKGIEQGIEKGIEQGIEKGEKKERKKSEKRERENLLGLASKFCSKDECDKLSSIKKLSSLKDAVEKSISRAKSGDVENIRDEKRNNFLKMAAQIFNMDTYGKLSLISDPDVLEREIVALYRSSQTPSM